MLRCGNAAEHVNQECLLFGSVCLSFTEFPPTKPLDARGLSPPRILTMHVVPRWRFSRAGLFFFGNSAKKPYAVRVLIGREQEGEQFTIEDFRGLDMQDAAGLRDNSELRPRHRDASRPRARESNPSVRIVRYASMNGGNERTAARLLRSFSTSPKIGIVRA
ncbi:MAG TPA: hypothetical protein VKB79_09395 [Bryobacteraceae bacterium]|nr:hypothetical protein [Bryobacteraceae bacterium]